MRAFCVLLLALNVVVLLVWTLPASDPPPPQPPRPADGSLQLLDEEEAMNSDTGSANTVQGTTADRSGGEPTGGDDDDGGSPSRDTVATGECYAATLDREQAAANLADAVADAGGTAKVDTVSDREWVGFWVYLPGPESVEEAQTTMDRLAEEGVSDYGYVGGEGEQQHAVSLGVFSTRERAERRQEDVRELGYAAEVTERYRTTSRFRVLAQVGSADDLPEGDWGEAEDCQAPGT